MEHIYTVTGMTCSGCEKTVRDRLMSVPEVASVEVSKDNATAVVISDSHVSPERLQQALGAESHYRIMLPGEHPHHPPQSLKRQKQEAGAKYYCPMHCEGEKIYDKPGSCPVCGMNLERLPSSKPTASFTCPMHPEIISDKPGDCPKCGMKLVASTETEDDDTFRDMRRKFIIAAGFTVPVLVLAMGEMVAPAVFKNISGNLSNWLQLFLTIPVIISTRVFFVRFWNSVKTRNFNMFTLIGLGTGVAFIYSIIALVSPDLFPSDFRHNGTPFVYFEAVAVILTLVLLGQLLEAKAHGRTSSAIRALLDLVPPTAKVIRDGYEVEVAVADVVKGDLIRIYPGERVPVDGVITEGASSIDESMVTGEPVPVEKKAGDAVISGTINGNGSIVMQAEKVGDDTLLSRIISMVNDATRSRAPIQKLVDRVSAIFVPAVVGIAVVTFVVWMLVGGENRYVYALTNAISVLIIACPCALGLATPMSVMVGVGRGAGSGVLIRNAEALEKIGKINTLVVDKTGTLTQGKPSVENVLAHGSFSESQVLRAAASVNRVSEHPLAAAIVSKARELKIPLVLPSQFQSITGKGVMAHIEGVPVHVGNKKLMLHHQIHLPDQLKDRAHEHQQKGKTVSFVAIGQSVAGVVVISDKIKSESKVSVARLKSYGIEVIMLTGDNRQTAQSVADELGLSGFESDMLPQDKMEKVVALQQQGKTVAMAGDGINDAPALARADVGIAMGTGADVAIESAEVTLIRGDLSGIGKAVSLGRAVMRNIRQNLFFAFFYNILGIPIAAGILYPFTGTLLSPMIAGAAMSVSSVSVIVNALRLRTATIS